MFVDKWRQSTTVLQMLMILMLLMSIFWGPEIRHLYTFSQSFAPFFFA